MTHKDTHGSACTCHSCDPPAEYCRECGCTLTAQEAGICSVCYRVLTEPES